MITGNNLPKPDARFADARCAGARSYDTTMATFEAEEARAAACAVSESNTQDTFEETRETRDGCFEQMPHYQLPQRYVDAAVSGFVYLAAATEVDIAKVSGSCYYRPHPQALRPPSDEVADASSFMGSCAHLR